MRSAYLGLALLVLMSSSCRRPREEPPEHLERLREWRSSAPDFWKVDDDGLLPWMGSKEADDIFRQGSVEGPPYGLGCEVVLHGYSERVLIKAGPESALADMTVDVWLGTDADRGRFWLRADGPDNANEMRMVFPIAGLRKGDPVIFDIRDRDALGSSGIDRVTGVLEGPPPFRLTSKAKIADVSCRPLVRAPFERALAAREPKAKESIRALGDRKPDPSRARLGWYSEARKVARSELMALAALGGWDEPRVASAALALQTAEAEVMQTFRTFVVEERERVGVEASLEDGLVVRARRVSEKPPEIELDVRNTSQAVIVLGATFHGLEAFAVDGTRTELYPDESTYDLRVEAGASVTLHYRATIGAEYDPPRAAMLIRAHRREVVLPLDRSFTSPVTKARLVAKLECDAKRVCVVRLTTDGGGSVADATRGLHIEPKVRGSRDGTEWKPYEWTLREKGVAAADIRMRYECRDFDAEIPWSVATDR